MTNPGGNEPKILYVDDETLALTYFGRAIGSLAPVVTATIAVIRWAWRGMLRARIARYAAPSR